MPNRTSFVVACPSCARKLDVKVELLGRDVECRHCQAIFNTANPTGGPTADQAIDRLLARAQAYVDSTLPSTDVANSTLPIQPGLSD